MCNLIKSGALHGYAVASDNDEPSELVCAVCKARGMGDCGK